MNAILSLTKLLAERAELDKTLATKLQKSILQEAIQGKLVPQDSNDEAATVLLERIREEKKKLVASGKLKKKDLTDSTIFKGDDNKYYEQIGGKYIDITEEIPFDIPNSWAWCRFGEYVKIKIGKT
ncbi:MAG: type I restriction endonuclease subunit S, partial [Bacteroidales bacterium]|nr:type I restriction endonuclease subunit S [Bacteroidales bacterium]